MYKYLIEKYPTSFTGNKIFGEEGADINVASIL